MGAEQSWEVAERMWDLDLGESGFSGELCDLGSATDHSVSSHLCSGGSDSYPTGFCGGIGVERADILQG